MNDVKHYCIEQSTCARVEKENAPFTRRGAWCELQGLADGSNQIPPIITLPQEPRKFFVECYG